MPKSSTLISLGLKLCRFMTCCCPGFEDTGTSTVLCPQIVFSTKRHILSYSYLSNVCHTLPTRFIVALKRIEEK